MLRIGVIGAGMIGQFLMQIIAESSSAKVVAVAGRRQRPDGPDLTHETPSQLIADSGVQAVIVCSPDETHEQYVLECLAARKPVLCEKPLAPSADACLRIVQAEVELNLPLVQVGYQRRFDPAYIALKAQIDRGSVGEPLLLHSTHRAPGPSRNRTADLLMSNAAVHDFDAARWLLGHELASATVYLPPAARQARDRFDPVLIVLRTDKDVIVSVELFVNAGYGCDVGAEVLGEQGTLSLGGGRPLSISREGMRSSPMPQSMLILFAEAYRRELSAWVDSVRCGRAPTPGAWDGYAATAVADACRRSIASGSAANVALEARPKLYPIAT